MSRNAHYCAVTQWSLVLSPIVRSQCDFLNFEYFERKLQSWTWIRTRPCWASARLYRLDGVGFEGLGCVASVLHLFCICFSALQLYELIGLSVFPVWICFAVCVSLLLAFGPPGGLEHSGPGAAAHLCRHPVRHPK